MTNSLKRTSAFWIVWKLLRMSTALCWVMWQSVKRSLEVTCLWESSWGGCRGFLRRGRIVMKVRCCWRRKWRRWRIIRGFWWRRKPSCPPSKTKSQERRQSGGRNWKRRMTRLRSCLEGGCSQLFKHFFLSIMGQLHTTFVGWEVVWTPTKSNLFN